MSPIRASGHSGRCVRPEADTDPDPPAPIGDPIGERPLHRSEPVSTEALIEPLFEALISGDRAAARQITEDSFETGASPDAIVSDLFWPVYETIERLHRADKMTTISHHMATRLLRTLVDQVALRYASAPSNGRTVFAMCGPTDADELGAQMAVDMLEASGFSVTFSGGGIANDEALETVQARRPDVLLLFASAASDLPRIRELIDTMREIGACKATQIAVGGGVFNRADGLAEEIGADIWSSMPADLVRVLSEQRDRRASADQRTVGRNRRKAA